MTRISKIVLMTAVPSALAAGGLALWFLVFSPQGAAAATPGSITEIVEVERLVTQESIEISGNIEPVHAADLAFPIAGYIDAIYVDVGDTVGIGTILAKLEDSQQRYDLASVEMEIDTENVTGTQRNIDLLELKLEMTRESLEDTRLTSTMKGLVTSVDAEAGDYVTALTAGTSADVVVRVIDRSAMIATVEVDELDAPFLRVGQLVEFQFDAYPDLEVSGEVSSVPLEARTTSQGIAVLDTEVIIRHPPVEILPYFTFAGEIFLADEQDILLLPEEAVITIGSRTMVLMVMSDAEAEEMMAERMAARGTVAGGAGETGTRPAPGGGVTAGADPDLPAGLTAVPVPVTVRDYGAGKVQVTDGLEEGDRIVVITPLDGTAGDAAGERESGSANVLEMLGMPSGPGSRGGSGGPPPGP